MSLQPSHDNPLDHDLLAELNRDLAAVVESTVDSIEGADHAAVSLVGSWLPLITTSAVAELLEGAQRCASEGPTLDAGRSGVITRINYLSDGLWPTFGTACSECKIRSVAAFPLTEGSTTVGVLTLYSSDHHAFGAPELRTGRTAAVEMTRLLHDR